MSAIRPLATIAVLAALGVYLAVKINEGPVVAVDDSWSQPAGPDAEQAPAWNGGPIEVPRPATIEAPTFEASPAATPPAPTPAQTPAMPSLPATPSLPAAPAAAPNGPPTLPENSPLTNDSTLPAQPPTGVTGRVPSLGTSTASLAPPSAVASPPPAFAAAWEAIQTALAQGQLTRAHRMLSRWRGEEGLSPMQEQEIDQLLGQLAGSVIYSTEHTLAPPHAVAPGETLATIAQQYDVPWQLLAKINGVATAEAVQPGQTVKVVRGPFEAEVDLQRGELVLLLDDCYAGRFPVRVEGVAPEAGGWRVGQKKLEPATQNAPGAVVAASAAMEPSVVLESPSGERVELSAGVTQAPGAHGRLTVASSDLADLYDILSVGSEVTIVR